MVPKANQSTLVQPKPFFTYSKPSISQLKEWLTRDDKYPGFLGEKQRQRYELKAKGIPEEKWPVDIWTKRNEKR